MILFGPQRLNPILKPELDRLGLEGGVAVITAGWQEREREDEELQKHLDRPLANLRLHSRSEQVYSTDPELFAAHRARQDRLQAIQQLYRYRLDFALEPARELMRRGGEPELLDLERDSAIEAIRLLDREHLMRVAEVHAEFDRSWRPTLRASVADHLAELREIVEQSSAILIAGGHVAVLLNRMRLFGIAEMIRDKPILAWSAGAMALSERIVLFHDSPPQGAGNSEILDVGLGLFRGLIPLPHAKRRLRLEDPVRVALFARRFSPDTCVPLDEKMSVRRAALGVGWEPGAGSLELTASGRVVPLGDGL